MGPSTSTAELHSIYGSQAWTRKWLCTKEKKLSISSTGTTTSIDTQITQKRSKIVTPPFDEYIGIESSKALIKGRTGITYEAEFDVDRAESEKLNRRRPSRYWEILKRCKQLGLLDRCLRITDEPDCVENIAEGHDKKSGEELQTSSRYCSAAKEAGGYAILLVEAVCKGQVKNGFAVTRLPGHLSTLTEHCGLAAFSNIHLAAQYALDLALAKKILIVNVDIHHGLATQRLFYESDKVLYFSIHRFDHGSHWPNKKESNFDHVGSGAGLGYNINVPLNTTGLSDSDYLSVIFQILLPVAFEFNPDLVIVAAGYDACMGCPEGQMELSPPFYGHLITLLSGFAMGKIAVCLEGGFFVPSLVEGAVFTIKALLGDPCHALQPVKVPHVTVIETINNLRIVLHRFWNCIDVFKMFSTVQSNEGYSQIKIKFDSCPIISKKPHRSMTLRHKYTAQINKYQIYCNKLVPNEAVACCYEDNQLLRKIVNTPYVEYQTPSFTIYQEYVDWGLDYRCINIDPLCDDVHIRNIAHQTYRDLSTEASAKCLTMHHNESTQKAIITAAECIVAVVDAVFSGTASSGVAVIRPSAHNVSESKSASGYCLGGSTVVAAKYILKKDRSLKILIIDFDIHHGNSIQKNFYDDNKILYISIHKYLPESFFPFSTEANYNYSGEGKGAGYNVNVAVESHQLHDVDYITIFLNVILPIAYSYNPDVILVSAGFDGGDYPLESYHLSPEWLGGFIQLLKPLANGKMILTLEGGYNLRTVGYATNIYIKTLLGDPLPILNDAGTDIISETKAAIDNVKKAHKQYWPVLNVDTNIFASSVSPERKRKPKATKKHD